MACVLFYYMNSVWLLLCLAENFGNDFNLIYLFLVTIIVTFKTILGYLLDVAYLVHVAFFYWIK